MNFQLQRGAFSDLAKRILYPLESDTGYTLLEAARAARAPMAFRLVDAAGPLGHVSHAEARDRSIFVRFAAIRASWTPIIEVQLGDELFATFTYPNREVFGGDTIDFEWMIHETRIERP